MRSYDGRGQVDFGEDTTWTTQVRDDANAAGTAGALLERRPSSTYAELAALRQRTTTATSGCAPRPPCAGEPGDRGVGRIEDRVVSFPQYAVLAGYIQGKNSGGHGGRPLVNSTGSLGRGGALRPAAAVAAAST